MNVTVVYLDNYKPDEEIILRTSGIATLRVNAQDLLADQTLTLSARPAPVLFRGRRMSLDAYGELYATARSGGLQPLTSPTSFGIAEDFQLHYPLLRKWSPAALVVDATAGPEVLVHSLATGVLAFPVFVRSDLESAAKYVGVGGCVLSTPSLEEASTVLNNLRQHVRGFRSIILKEMRPMRRKGGASVEYRAVGLRGQLLHFDYSSTKSSLDDPYALGLDAVAEECFEALGDGGADGAVLVDLGVQENGSPVVVECKDFLSGGVRQPEILAEKLTQRV